MSLAVAKAILDYNNNYAQLGEMAVKCMQEVGQHYPDCGYGGHFHKCVSSACCPVITPLFRHHMLQTVVIESQQCSGAFCRADARSQQIQNASGLQVHQLCSLEATKSAFFPALL